MLVRSTVYGFHMCTCAHVVHVRCVCISIKVRTPIGKHIGTEGMVGGLLVLVMLVLVVVVLVLSSLLSVVVLVLSSLLFLVFVALLSLL